MTTISNERLEILIAFAEQTSKPWLCVEVARALRELQALRKSSPTTSSAPQTDR